MCSGRLVALKKVFVKDVQGEGIPECIAREIHALRAVDHPNVIELLDVYPKVRAGCQLPARTAPATGPWRGT